MNVALESIISSSIWALRIASRILLAKRLRYLRDHGPVDSLPLLQRKSQHEAMPCTSGNVTPHNVVGGKNTSAVGTSFIVGAQHLNKNMVLPHRYGRLHAP